MALAVARKIRRVTHERRLCVVWPEAALRGSLLFRRCQGISRHKGSGPKMTRVTLNGSSGYWELIQLPCYP
jgi:hypothetical protein